jgi:formyl-CoA transferase
LLGEHTAEILSEVLGYSADEMNEIIASGAVGEVKAAAE